MKYNVSIKYKHNPKLPYITGCNNCVRAFGAIEAIDLVLKFHKMAIVDMEEVTCVIAQDFPEIDEME